MNTGHLFTTSVRVMRPENLSDDILECYVEAARRDMRRQLQEARDRARDRLSTIE